MILYSDKYDKKKNKIRCPVIEGNTQNSINYG
jgi:hypothetical protein